MSRLPDGQYRLSTAAWPNHFVYMQDSFTGNVRSWRGDPGPQGHWQLMKHPNYPDYYLLSPRRWPECFIFMERGFSGNIRGWSNCDPGAQGYWKLSPVTHGGGEGLFYLIPQAWEESNWSTYMESGMYGNLSSWRGEPGPQGWFKIEPFAVPGVQAPPLVMTAERLATMPRLGDVASGYSGPSSVLAQPQLVSEIRLEVVKADGVNLESLHPTERSLTFHVDQSRIFIQNIGRQYQQAFFDQFVPNRQLWSTLSRTIFELRLEPPATSPTLVKHSKTGTLCIGSTPMQTNESVQVSEGTRIGLGTNERSLFLVMNLNLRRSSAQEIQATCANLRAGNAPNAGYAGGRDYCTRPQLDPIYSPPVQGGEITTNPQLGHTGAYDTRPPAPPYAYASRNDRQPPAGGYDFATAIAPSPSPSLEAVLECIFSVGLSDLSTANVRIPLKPNETFPIGRTAQTNFFEKLLPSMEDLKYISRNHLQAYFNASNKTMDITNLSPNAVLVDAKTVQLGQKGEMCLGSSLKFLAGERTLVSFMLKFA